MEIPFFKKVLVPECVGLQNTPASMGSKSRIYLENNFKEKLKRIKFSNLSNKDVLTKYKIEKHDDNYCKINLSSVESKLLDEIYDTPVFDAPQFNGYIAGGSCSRMLFGVEGNIKFSTTKPSPEIGVDYFTNDWPIWTTEALLSGDIDVFFPNESEAKQYIQYLNNYESLCWVEEKGYEGEWGTNHTGRIHKNENIDLKIQVIVKNKEDNEVKDINGIIDVFDLSASKMYIKDDYIFMHKLALAGLLQNKLIANNFYNVDTFSRRIIKYMMLYGYEEVDISPIPQLLNEPNNKTYLKLYLKNIVNPLNEILNRR